MKSYTITVNGNVYDVTVEENGAATPAAAAAPRNAADPWRSRGRGGTWAAFRRPCGSRRCSALQAGLWAGRAFAGCPPPQYAAAL